MNLHSICDVLALIPYRLGFHPADSAVLLTVCYDGVRRTAGPMARFDLTDLTEPGAGDDLARGVARVLLDPWTERVLVVLYADGPFHQACRQPELHHAAAVVEDALGRAAGTAEPEVPWLVARDGWGHLHRCSCCAEVGEPLERIENAPAAAGMVMRGRVARASRAELAVAPAADADARARAEEEWAAETDRLEQARAAGGPALGRWRTEAVRRWDAAGPTPPAETLGRLGAGLRDAEVRDAVIGSALGVGSAAELLGGGLAEALEKVRAPGDGLRRVEAIAEQVAAHAPPAGAAQPLAVVAYLAWWANDGARAEVVSGQVVAEEPDHRLARLVRGALGAAVPPPWLAEGHRPVSIG